MIVMRERSGRSGRRRGSQKLGTAIGSDVTAGVFGTPGPTLEGGGPDCRGVWACATVVATSRIIIAHAPLRRRHVLNFAIIRQPFPEIARTISSPRRRASHIRGLRFLLVRRRSDASRSRAPAF